MLKRIDGIYKCEHPNALADATNGVHCPDCPYSPRPSQFTLGKILKFVEIDAKNIIVDERNDIFMVMVPANGRK